MRIGREPNIREFPSRTIDTKIVNGLNINIQDDTIHFKVDTLKIHHQPKIVL